MSKDYKKLYEEALERARKLATDLPNGRNDRLYHVWDLENIFPELKESEDERIKNEIIAFVEQSIHRGGGTPIPQEQEDKWITWLEKQGEQNPTPKFKIGDTIHKIGENTVFPMTIEKIEDGYYVCNNSHSFVNIEFQDYYELVEQKPSWSEEDSKNLNSVKWIIENSDNLNKIFETIDSPDYIKKYFIDWLKSLKDRVQPKSKQEWSEEDEDVINHLIAICAGAKRYRQFAGCLQDDITKYQTWLKSIKPNHWKPSEEQMKALIKRTKGLHTNSETRKVLESLIFDLQEKL